MILTRSRLAEIGERLYGEAWPEVLAAKLNRSRKTIARWRSGESKLPKGLKPLLLNMLEQQMLAAGRALDEIGVD
jgi:hypothetical protein